MERFKNLKELIELKSIQQEGNRKLCKLEEQIRQDIILHSIEQPTGILISLFNEEKFAAEFASFTYEEDAIIDELRSIEFSIALSLKKDSGYFRFIAEPLLTFRTNHCNFPLIITYGISCKKINDDFFSIAEHGNEGIILFEKEEHFLSIKKQIEEILPSIKEIFEAVNDNYNS